MLIKQTSMSELVVRNLVRLALLGVLSTPVLAQQTDPAQDASSQSGTDQSATEEVTFEPIDPSSYDASKLVLAESQGVIEELNFAGNSILISGYIYPVSPAVKVEIGGTYGAFTMLTEGMSIRFSYLKLDANTKLVTEIIEDASAEEF